MFQHALKFFTWFSACLEIFNIVSNTMVHKIGEFQNSTFDIFIPLMQRVVNIYIVFLLGFYEYFGMGSVTI